MTQFDQPSPIQPVPVAIEQFERLYLRVRRALAEAQSRATTDAELRFWQARSSRMRRLREMLDPDQLSEVLEAIAALYAEQQETSTAIAAQLAAVDIRSHR